MANFESSEDLVCSEAFSEDASQRPFAICEIFVYVCRRSKCIATIALSYECVCVYVCMYVCMYLCVCACLPSLSTIIYKYSYVDHLRRRIDLACAACDGHPADCSACHHRFLRSKIRVNVRTRKQFAVTNLWLNLYSTTTFRYQLLCDGTTCRQKRRVELTKLLDCTPLYN